MLINNSGNTYHYLKEDLKYYSSPHDNGKHDWKQLKTLVKRCEAEVVVGIKFSHN